MSMKSRILCCFVAGIFLMTLVNARAAQGKAAASTADGPAGYVRAACAHP